jgi:hypothetical protein
MSIEKIVEQALQDGYLTPAMEAEIGRLCNNTSLLSNEEHIALDRLMGALVTGEVLADDNTGGSSPTPSPRRPVPTPGSYDSAELPIVAAVVRSAIP